tara:strand:+ start:39 stop:731 length:693 start_codon:yes stop_codon:yes gene_type:complete
MKDLENLLNKIKDKKFIDKTELSKELILVLALGHLGGLKEQVYTEEITAKAFEWSPKEFSWSLSKFAKFPDKESARRPLLNARDKYKLISGSYARDLSYDGWRLTSNGVKLFNEIKYLLSKKSHKSKLSKSEIALLNKQIKNKDMYKKFRKNKDLNGELKFNVYELAEFLDCSPDQYEQMRRKFFKQNAQVQELPNQEMISFYNLLSEKFNNILNYELFLNEQKVKYRAK